MATAALSLNTHNNQTITTTTATTITPTSNFHDRAAQLATPTPAPQPPMPMPMDQHNLAVANGPPQQQQQQQQQQGQQSNQQQQQQQQQHPNSSPANWLASASAPAPPGAPTNPPPSAQAPAARASDNPTTAFDPAFGAGYQYFPHLDSNQLLPGNPAGPGAPQPAGQDPLGPSLGPSSKLSGQKRSRDPDDADEGDGDFGSDWMPGPDDARIGHNSQQVNGLPPPNRAPNPPGASGPPGGPMKLTKTHTDPLISQALNTDGTPKRPMNAFMIFARKRRPEVAAENPALRTGEISKLLSKEWKTIDPPQKQFYLEKAKSLKDNFTALFPQYVYRRRPNHSRKKRKTEPDAGAGYGGLNPRQEDSPDEHDDSPGPAPYMHGPSAGYAGHHHMTDPMGHRPGSAFDSQHSYAQPSHYGHMGHGGHRQSSGGSLRHFDGGSAGPGVWYDKAKIEPESPRMRNSSFGNGMNGAPSNRSSSGTGYFSIPSPNFGPAPLPPGGRQSGSNPPSANQTPLLTPSITPAIPSSSMGPLAGGGSHPATNPPNGNWMSSASSSLGSYAHSTGATNGSHPPLGGPPANGSGFFDWPGNRSALPSPAPAPTPGSGPAANNSGASQAASGRGGPGLGGMPPYRTSQPSTVQGVLGNSGGPPSAQAATAGRGSQW